MKKYYICCKKNSGGDNEVHKEGCENMPHPLEREYLGKFPGCSGAILEAGRRYTNAIGCPFCSIECETYKIWSKVY